MSIPFSRQPFIFQQPDGTAIHLLGWGNQFDAVFETVDGYTVTQDSATGYYHYATLSADRTQLLPLARVSERGRCHSFFNRATSALVGTQRERERQRHMARRESNDDGKCAEGSVS